MHGAGSMILMMPIMLLFWGAIIFGVVWLIRGFAPGGHALRENLASQQSPIEILERRFAEGEVTEDDYRARREVLVNGGTAGADGARKQLLTTP
jgi:putative membrane protein